MRLWQSMILAFVLSGCSFFKSTPFKPDIAQGILPPLPSGYCYLDSQNPQEARLLYKIQDQYGRPGKLKLTVFLPCQELESIRNRTGGQRLTHYGMFIELPRE